MCLQHAHILTPLAKLTSANTKFKWTGVEKKDFDVMKRLVRKYYLLTYPNLSK